MEKMNKEIIHMRGKIHFDIENVTKKHISQSNWKKTAIITMSGDICDYYAWFIKKRFNLILNPPLRNAHVTIINDRTSDINDKWDEVKAKWNGQVIDVYLNVDVRTSGVHWWLNLLNNDKIIEIRSELGLSDPFFKLHLTIGYANEKNMEHSKYIHRLIINNLI